VLEHEADRCYGIVDDYGGPECLGSAHRHATTNIRYPAPVCHFRDACVKTCLLTCIPAGDAETEPLATMSQVSALALAACNFPKILSPIRTSFVMTIGSKFVPF